MHECKKPIKWYGNKTKNMAIMIENNEINFDDEKSAIGDNCFETKCVADPALLEKIISASKVGVSIMSLTYLNIHFVKFCKSIKF